MSAPERVTPDLDTLIGLFYDSPAELGEFTHVEPADLPADYQTLLAHQHHMTVTVEQFHGTLVDVQVLDKHIDGELYARKILLLRQTDGAVVQYGIMRVSFAHLSPAVRKLVAAEQTPLGRILIENNVHRQIRLDAVWRVEPGPELCELFRLESPQTIYGRTAMIDCDGEPAIELLEIVVLHEPASFV